MWQICSNIALPIITFNLQFLAAFIYSHSRNSANTLPLQKAAFSERQTFPEMTERVLMETRHPDTFGSFAVQPGHAPGCDWVPWALSVTVQALALCCRECRKVQSQCKLPSQGSGHLTKLSDVTEMLLLCLLPAWPILQDAGHAQTLPGQWGSCREQGALWTLPTSAHQLHHDLVAWMKMCSSCGGLLTLPRALLHPGMALVLWSPGLYICTAMADPFGRWSGLICRCYQRPAILAQPSVPSKLLSCL